MLSKLIEGRESGESFTSDRCVPWQGTLLLERFVAVVGHFPR
jgi:hypothetical protein